MATFGWTDSSHAGAAGADTLGDMLGNTFQLTENALVDSISAFWEPGGGSTMPWRGCIYPVTGTGPTALPDGKAPIAATPEATSALTGFSAAPFSAPVALTAGWYYIGAWFGGGGIGVPNLGLDTTAGGDVNEWDWMTVASNPYSSSANPATFSSHGTGFGTWVLFATYHTPSSGWTDLTDPVAQAGYTLTRTTKINPFDAVHQVEFVTEYAKLIVPPTGGAFMFGAKGSSLIDSATADANALASLNAKRRHRYTGSPTGGTLVPTLHGDMLAIDQS